MPSSNPLLKIPHHQDFTIPVYFSDDISKSYVQQLKNRFDKIKKFLERYGSSWFLPDNKDNVLIKLDDIQKRLIKVVEEYLKGHPSQAYSLFSKMMDECGIGDEIRSSQQYKLNKDSVLFRTQKQYPSDLKKKHANKAGFLEAKKISDLFHPPFQRRRSVSTNRFSISGYPCLYLSETLLTSFSECFPEKPKDPPVFNAICLKASRPLYFIDLSEDKFKHDPLNFGSFAKGANPEEDVSHILDHLGMHHLVIATHTKIQYQPTYKGETYFFKAEYIIPQLLLQWVKLEGYAIDGIRYKSCTGTNRFPGIKNHYNYVLPVKSSPRNGFCPSLKRLFRFSPVYNYYGSVSVSGVKKLLLSITDELKSKKMTLFKTK